MLKSHWYNEMIVTLPCFGPNFLLLRHLRQYLLSCQSSSLRHCHMYKYKRRQAQRHYIFSSFHVFFLFLLFLAEGLGGLANRTSNWPYLSDNLSDKPGVGGLDPGSLWRPPLPHSVSTGQSAGPGRSTPPCEGLYTNVIHNGISSSLVYFFQWHNRRTLKKKKNFTFFSFRCILQKYRIYTYKELNWKSKVRHHQRLTLEYSNNFQVLLLHT